MNGSQTSNGAANKRAFLLRFLSGPHSGAEVELDEHDQQITIGSDEGCDLILEDALVAPRHMMFQFSNGALLLKPLGGRVFLGGKWVREEQVDVQPFQFVTVGTTQIVAGPSGEIWPELTAGDAPTIEKISDETPVEVMQNAEIVAVDSTAANEITADKKRSHRRKLRRVLFCGVAVLFVGIALLAALPQKKQLRPMDVERFVRAEIADMEYDSSVDVRLEDGRIIVEGYVPTNQELRNLKERLSSLYSGLRFSVRSDEKIIRAIEDTIGDVGTSLAVISVKPGIYSIRGYMYESENLQKIRNRLSQGIPGVKKAQVDVMTSEAAGVLAVSSLDEFGLRQQITVQQEPNRIIFRGSVSALQAEKWRNAAENIIRKFGDVIPVEFDVRSLSAQSDPAGIAFFAQPIQAITIGSMGLSWITTQDGRKYFEGSFLSSGWRIDSISSSGLKFSRDGNQLSLRLEALR
ncbi:MAG: type III secretion system inner membrane ring subunit SctD [Puniceicoccales bacterium]|jgi:type III secretion system YscD/HrpQ family protein|nr:type III secretion system inner membrane ring subunit SctD [Puniceicoccales bacterium]